MFSEADAEGKSRRGVAVRSSTMLLLLAMLGCALRALGAAPALQHYSQAAMLLLMVLAPVWAMLAGMLATVYLMLGMWRPFNPVQHLVELVVAVGLIAAMQPPHLG